jgi:beta-lactamase class A
VLRGIHRYRTGAVACAALLVALAALAAPTAGAPESTQRAKTKPNRLLVSDARIRAARRYARTRAGHVGFAVLDADRDLRGWHRTHTFPSASLSKAMLLVALLRKQGRHALTAWQRSLLESMVRYSDNDAARAVYGHVGGAGMLSVARAARMHRFHDVGYWSDAVLTPADQVRLFARIDRLVPRRHKLYLRGLLRSITGPQRWGIAAVADHRGWRILFKGGWRTGLAHQAALVEHDRRRVAISVLTDHNPSQQYGIDTIRGIAQRLIGRWR